jgi:hypothetical protein
MLHKERNTTVLFIAVVTASMLGWYIHTWTPSSVIAQSGFFVLFFLTIFTLLLYIVNNTRRALLVSVGFTLFLVLRAAGLREWWYVALLTASLLSMEWLFGKR